MRQTLWQDKFEDIDFKFDNDIFKFQPQNTEIWHFWSQISDFHFFLETLQQGKFEGADFRYDSGFSKSQPKIPK